MATDGGTEFSSSPVAQRFNAGNNVPNAASPVMDDRTLLSSTYRARNRDRRPEYSRSCFDPYEGFTMEQADRATCEFRYENTVHFFDDTAD